MINKSKAERMFTVLCKAPMSEAVKSKLAGLSIKGNVDEIWKYFTACLEHKKEVGESIDENSNKPSFEQLYNELEKVYFNDLD